MSGFSLDFRAHSETGLVRRNNQDSGYASPTALVIADGMGGAAAGDLASAVAIREVTRADGSYPNAELIDRLQEAMQQANQTLMKLVAADHSLDGMGTTFCGGFFSGTQMGIVHIGDSRGYLLRDDHLSRLTHDHSWVQSLIDEGRITEEESLVHPHRSLVLKVLNGQPHHLPDTFSLDVQAGDLVLFCSDGLCGFTTDEVIQRALALDDLDQMMTDLIAAAHEGGGADNITIVLARVVAEDEELAAREPAVIGAAAEVEVPELSAAVDLEDSGPAVDDGSAHTPSAPAPALTKAEAETVRYSPTMAKRRGWSGIVVSLLVVAMLGVLGFAGYRWTQTRYYVADNAGAVAIFRGVQVPLVPLSSVVEQTSIVTGELPVYQRGRVTAGIPSGSLAQARETVAELTRVAGACPGGQPPIPTAQPSPTGQPTPTGQPSSIPSGTASPTPGGTASPSLTATSSPAASTTPSTTPTPSSSPVPSSGGPTNGEC